MDPVKILCEERSFAKFYNYDMSIIPLWMKGGRRGDVKLSVSQGNVEGYYVDDKLHNTVEKYRKLKEKVKLYDEFARDNWIKLANIDTVFTITPAAGGFYQLRDNSPGFTFVDLNFTFNGFSKYIQYRESLAVGYGLGKGGDGDIDWMRLKLSNISDMNNMENILSFINFVKSEEIEGVDLVVGEGTDKLVERLYIMMKVLKKGGLMVIGMNDTYQPLIVDILYAVSLCFNRIILFKPCTSPAYSNEKYLIGLEFKNESKAIEKLIENNKITTLYKELPDEFETWIVRLNDRFVKMEIEALKYNIAIHNQRLAKKKGKEFEKIRGKRYDMHRLLIALHLPDH